MKKPIVHLDIHPAHRGKHAAIGAVRLTTLDFKEPLEQVLVGFYPKEGLTNYDKTCQLQHRVGGKMLQLDPILVEEVKGPYLVLVIE
jgi:hypothetical protein